MDQKKSVPEFYDGKSIFITGGTGFLGKVFVAKILYDCPKINKIYLLVREKRGISAEKRVVELMNNPLFSRLRIENPDALNKVVPIPGDVTAPDLGISADDERELVDKVSIVFHVAATIKFNEPLRRALKDNVEGTTEVLKLCQRLQNIQIMVHVSTAYSNCLENVIEEKLYPPPTDLTELNIRLQNTRGGDLTDMLNGWPNTYTFTKALAENYLQEHRGNVPVIIVRPSIIGAIDHDPLEGWIDNWYGATGILVPIARGLNRVLLGKGTNVVDLIPVDYIANLGIIAAALNERPKDVIVYNVCSSSGNPLTLSNFINLFVEAALKKRDYVFPWPGLYFITNYKWIFMIITFMTQLLAYLYDVMQRLRGKPPKFINLISRIIKTRDTVEFFTTNSWVMKNDRVRSLFASLSPQDQQTFTCDPNVIDWRHYLPKYYDGVLRYVENKKK